VSLFEQLNAEVRVYSDMASKLIPLSAMRSTEVFVALARFSLARRIAKVGEHISVHSWLGYQLSSSPFGLAFSSGKIVLCSSAGWYRKSDSATASFAPSVAGMDIDI
jgi:hypothetical protein